LAFLEHFVKRSKHREVTATGAPRRVIGSNGFLGEFLPWRFRYCRAALAVWCYLVHKIFNQGTQENRKSEPGRHLALVGFVASRFIPIFLLS
jgi:hypothetical protein